jgi:YD repeat-containing protein
MGGFKPNIIKNASDVVTMFNDSLTSFKILACWSIGTVAARGLIVVSDLIDAAAYQFIFHLVLSGFECLNVATIAEFNFNRNIRAMSAPTNLLLVLMFVSNFFIGVNAYAQDRTQPSVGYLTATSGQNIFDVSSAGEAAEISIRAKCLSLPIEKGIRYTFDCSTLTVIDGVSDPIPRWSGTVKIVQTDTYGIYPTETTISENGGAIHFLCRPGYYFDPDGKYCWRIPGSQIKDKCTGCPAMGVGNPIDVGSGNKFQRELDYLDPYNRLSFMRSHNGSGAVNNARIGYRWMHTFGRSVGAPQAGIPKLTTSAIVPSSNAGGFVSPPVLSEPNGIGSLQAAQLRTMTVSRADGRVIMFDGSTGAWKADNDVNSQLLELKDSFGVRTGWRYTEASDETDEFDAQGRLIRVSDTAGNFETLTYLSSGLLDRVTDRYGRFLQFSYDTSGWISSIQVPGNRTLNYSYDNEGHLVSVIYVGAAGATAGADASKTYHYESLPELTRWSLTGITDEANNRYATFAYDSTGRAISSEHAGGVDKVTIEFDALGTGGHRVLRYRNTPTAVSATEEFGFAGTTAGVNSFTSYLQPAGAGSAAVSRSRSLDSNGNVNIETDFKGATTTRTFDTLRNLETKRVESSASASARTISTQWHPHWRKVVRQAQAKQIATYVYQGQPDPTAANALANCLATGAPLLSNGKPMALLCKKVEQATTDETGASAFTAVASGTARVWTYSYGIDGRLLVENGPRTDVTDTTTYEYYAVTDTAGPAKFYKGDLKKMTNSVGQITTYDEYEASGRLQKMTDPNGTITTMTYHVRGWLTSVARTAGTVTQTTTYEYWPFGKLKKITQPDGSYLGYSYDPAQRLVGITDNVNNMVLYTLDNAGNRIKEEYEDPSGLLKRNVTRAYDALNRLQSITGAQQ